MFKCSVRFYILFLFSIPCISFAQTFTPVSNPDKVLTEIKKVSKSASSIQADFDEEKYLSVLKVPNKSSGVFYYKRDDKMRWEQRAPSKHVILINAGRIRIQDAGREKNIGAASRIATQINDLMIGLVNGDFQDSKAFKQALTENSEFYQVTLIPVNKRMKNVYSKIALLFPKTSLRLKELSFYEKGGDKNIMRFHNEKINQPIAESVFLNL